MKLSPELNGARLSVTQAAELVGMHPSHLRRLCRQGIFPKAKQTAKRRPFFDRELLEAIQRVVRTGVGLNGTEVCFYRRKKKHQRMPVETVRKVVQSPDDGYLADIVAGIADSGFPKLSQAAVSDHIKALFGEERPPLGEAIRAIAQRIATGEQLDGPEGQHL